MVIKKQIEDHRAEIDLLDAQLLVLLNRRAEVAKELGKLKLYAARPLYDRRRELLVLRRLQENNPGPLDKDSIGRIFRLVIRESRLLQSSSNECASAGAERCRDQQV